MLRGYSTRNSLFLCLYHSSYHNKKGPPEGEPETLFRYNYLTITTRLVLLIGKMFCEEPTPFQVN